MSLNVQQAYNQWAKSYDAVDNKTRDLDKAATQQTLAGLDFQHILELGCGTGKNTEWLKEKAAKITAVDFSEAMLKKAQDKISAPNIRFLQADITQPWQFNEQAFDLVTCNLILEHIQNLDFVFAQAYKVLQEKGKFFISELHPAKQYLGSKARFEKENELIVLDCYVHHASDFFNSARNNGFHCIQFNEWFDEENKDIPRLIGFLFEKVYR